MIEPEELIAKIQDALPGAEVDLEDLTGSKDHYKARIVAEQFDDQNRVARHRMIYDALAEEMKGPIHALTLDVYTPDEWAEEQS